MSGFLLNPFKISIPLLIDYLVVGAGGGAAFHNTSYGSGGGGGQVLTGTGKTIVGSVTVTIGIGATSNPALNTDAPNGGNSVFSDITAIGGKGAIATGKGGDSGSGKNGGTGGGAPVDYAGGGGAGDNGNGQNGATNDGGDGGAGTSNSITGTAVIYGCGGGGASDTVGGTGDALGGGHGGTPDTGATSGTNGLGTGAGAKYNVLSGTKGGDGVVILKYPDTYTITAGGNLVSSTSTSSGYKITTFTAGTGTISFS